MIPHEFLGLYIAANAIGVAMLALAMARPRAARWACIALFAWASVTNTYTALHKTQDYLGYAGLTFSETYRSFITGWFSDHIRLMVLPIAAGQMVIALLMMGRGALRRLGEAGAVVFLLAIVPLGVGAGMPFSFVVIAALVFMDRGLERDNPAPRRQLPTADPREPLASPLLLVLVALIAKLSCVAAATGLFYDTEGERVVITSVEDAAMRMYGHGLYRFDSLLVGAGFRGVDAVTLFVAVPLLLTAAWFAWRGSFRGVLLLIGTLAYFLYNYASMAFGAAYNGLFLVYVALFSLSLFALVLAAVSVDLRALPSRFSTELPHREIASYLVAVGCLLLMLWLGDVISAMLKGAVPAALGSYTTIPTYVLDLGLIVPAAFVAAVLLLQRRPLGYLLSATLLTVNFTLGAALLSQGIAILLAGVPMPIPQIAGMIGSFAVLSAVGCRLGFVLLRDVRDEPRQEEVASRAA